MKICRLIADHGETLLLKQGPNGPCFMGKIPSLKSGR